MSSITLLLVIKKPLTTFSLPMNNVTSGIQIELFFHSTVDLTTSSPTEAIDATANIMQSRLNSSTIAESLLKTWTLPSVFRWIKNICVLKYNNICRQFWYTQCLAKWKSLHLSSFKSTAIVYYDFLRISYERKYDMEKTQAILISDHALFSHYRPKASLCRRSRKAWFTLYSNLLSNRRDFAFVNPKF